MAHDRGLSVSISHTCILHTLRFCREYILSNISYTILNKVFSEDQVSQKNESVVNTENLKRLFKT